MRTGTDLVKQIELEQIIDEDLSRSHGSYGVRAAWSDCATHRSTTEDRSGP